MKVYFVLSFIETHIYIPKVEKCSELGILRGSLFLSISSKRQYKLKSQNCYIIRSGGLSHF